MTKPVRLICGTRETRAQFSQNTALGRSLQMFKNVPDVQLHLFEQNKHGLPTIYNVAIRYAEEQPAILVFIHDDITLHDFFWTERIREGLAQFDVVGLAGNRRRQPRQPAWAFATTTPTWQWDEPRFLSGSVGHGKNFGWDNLSVYGPSGQECKLLDGLLLAVDSETLMRTGLRFDEQFMFHFYDMDFCRQAELLGVRMGTWPLSVVHQSGGAFGTPAWQDGYQRYLAKYGE